MRSTPSTRPSSAGSSTIRPRHTCWSEIASYQEERLQRARRAFRQALADDRTHDIADRWIEHVDRAEAARAKEQPG